jgi:DDE superfamily endonuclease
MLDLLTRTSNQMIAGLNSHAPMHALDLPAVAAGQCDWSSVRWGGATPDLSRMLLAMKGMHADVHAPDSIKTCVMLILDGTGTSIYSPTDPEDGAKMYCYWKQEDQMRWYIAVDAKGHIDFVSSVYNGKLDDSTALVDTGFYECDMSDAVLMSF